MSVAFDLAGKSNAIYGRIWPDRQCVRYTREQKDEFWADLSSDASRAPSNDYLLFVLINANARTSVRIYAQYF